MTPTDALAFDRLLREYLEACRNAMSEGAHPGWGERVVDLRSALRESEAGRPARTVLEALRNGRTSYPAFPVAALDDAEAWIDHLTIPELLPSPECRTLVDVGQWAQRHGDRLLVLRTIEVGEVRNRINRSRDRRLAELSRANRAVLRAELGWRRLERLAIYATQERWAPTRSAWTRHDLQTSADDALRAVGTARGRLERALIHGLAYGLEPEALMQYPNEGRIGSIADGARRSLAEYRAARIAAGRGRVSRHTTRLTDCAATVAPDLFAR